VGGYSLFEFESQYRIDPDPCGPAGTHPILTGNKVKRKPTKETKKMRFVDHECKTLHDVDNLLRTLCKTEARLSSNVNIA
jgi:hypothetical protein